MRRRKMTRRASKKSFRRGATQINRRNLGGTLKRGGNRM